MKNDRLHRKYAELRWLVACGICLMTTCISAQGEADSVNLLLKAQVAVTSSHVTHPSHVTDWHDNFQNSGDWRQPSREHVFWVKLDSAQIPGSGLLAIRGQLAVTLWAIGAGDTTVFNLGLSRPMHKLPLRGVSDIMPIDQLSKTKTEVILRIIPFTQQPYPVTVTSVTSAEHEQLQLKGSAKRLGYHLFLGAGVLSLLFLAGFALFLFYENRKKDYLYYALYMICMALYFGRLLEYYYEVPVFWGFFYEGYGLAEILALMLSYVMYVLFVRYFLSLDSAASGIVGFVKIWIAVCLLMGMTGLILSLLNISSPVFLKTYTYVRFLMPVMVIYLLWGIYKARLEFSGYVILGSVFLLLAGLLALTVTFILPDSGSDVLREPFFFMLCGVLLESFCFALGLGKQARQTEVDKIASQNQLILHLQKEAQLERDIRESQVQALQAQMNPHFIFNALNSVQHFILSNQKEMSVRYLSRVSQLIRRILQNSTTSNIILDEELSTLNAYIEIEQLRFHPAFAYTCTVDDAVDTEMIRIPHLMIQPFIENAILHGLVSKKDQGILTLDVHMHSEKAIEVVITDNGIGREAAAKIVTQSPRKHNSISTGSIEARIRLLMPEEPNPMVIEDLKDENGMALGARVRLIIPIV